jgi:hypothetical protein
LLHGGTGLGERLGGRTLVVFSVIRPEPPAAACTDRLVSLVLPACSSTALAMAVCRSEMCAGSVV